MANDCWNNIKIFARNKNGSTELKKLWMRIGHMMDSGVNGFGDYPSWYGNLLIAHGVEEDDINDARGSIEELYWDDSRDCISISTDTAWNPKMHIIEQMLENYDDLDYVYVSEEPGMRIYINSDTTGKFFTDRYDVDYDLGTIACDHQYVEDWSEVVDIMENISERIHEKYPDFKCILDETDHMLVTAGDVNIFCQEVEDYLTPRGEFDYIAWHEFDYS